MFTANDDYGNRRTAGRYAPQVNFPLEPHDEEWPAWGELWLEATNETNFLISALPQAGQGIFSSADDTSSSNCCPHFSHLNSNNGIIVLIVL